MFDWSGILQEVQEGITWLIAGLAYPIADGNALAFTRFLAAFAIMMALRASGYRHWTLRAGLGILMFFLAMDAVLGLAPGRVQNLTVAILGRNIAIYLICFGLAFFPSSRAAAQKRNRLERQSRARQVALSGRVDGKETL